MRFAGLQQSQNLQIFRYADIDHFRHGLRGANVDIVPLANVDVPLGQAVLSLSGCDLYLLQTFPRIVHARLECDCAFAALSMKDKPAIIFNGKEDESRLRFACGPIEYKIVEKEPGYYAVLVFSLPTENRGWPETDGDFLSIPISRSIELKLRQLVMRIFIASSQNPDLTLIRGGSAGLIDTLLEALDSVLDGYLSVKSPKKEGIHDSLRLLSSVDDLINSSPNPIYSADIATGLGVSVRTLTSLMVRANGMSLQRYIRLRRLWAIRRQLLTSEPHLQIKEIALANGFWHLGDFAAAYSSQFGELPSSTRARARR